MRVGKYGPYLEHGTRKASLPDDLAPDELTLSKALEMLERAALAEEPLGFCPETGKPVFLKTGRYGPYVQRGYAQDDEKPQNASLLKGMTPEDVDLAMALGLLTLPRTLGEKEGEAIVVSNGRFGPYVKCGSETRSLPGDMSPLDIDLEQALALLAQPKAQRRGFGAARTPLKTLDASPVTGQPVQLFSGRYGLYVTDGTTNASLPRELPAEELTNARALELLAARAAACPSKKARRAPARGAKKAATPKKAATAKAATAKSSTASGKPRKSAKRAPAGAQND